MNHGSQNIELAKLLKQTSWASRLAVTLVGPGEADDLLQEAWAQTLAHPPQEVIESPRAWLGAILRRGALKKRRSAGRRADRERRAAREEAQPSTHILRVREEDRRLLVEAVLGLPEDLREPLVLRYFDELSPSAIAERLGMSPSTVRSRLQRGLARLREQLEQDRGEDWRGWCLGLIPAGFESTGTAAAKTIPTKALPVLLALLIVVASLVGLRALGQDLPEESDTELIALAPDQALESHEEDKVLVPATESGSEREAGAPDGKPQSNYLPATPEVCTFVVQGICLDGAKNPVAGVRVRVGNLYATPSTDPEPSTVSGADGRFVLPIGPWSSESVSTPPDSAVLFFEADRFRAAAQQVQLGAEREINVGSVDMIPAPRSIRGRVLSSDGLDANGAWIFLMRDFEVEDDMDLFLRAVIVRETLIPIGLHGFIETDAGGNFHLQAVPEEPVRLAVFFNGHDGLLTEPMRMGSEERLELGDMKLEACVPDRSVRGRVIHKGGGSVHGAWVTAKFSEDDWESSGMGAPVVVGADGQFCMPVPPGNSCELTVQSHDRRARSRKNIRVPAGTSDLVLTMEPLPEPKSPKSTPDSMPRVHGRVLHEGKGVAGAWITSWGVATDDRSRGKATHYTSARSGEDGHFEISMSCPGPCRIEASFGPWQEPLIGEWGPVESNGIVSDVELELSAPGTLVGEIAAPSSEPMIGSKVVARSPGRKDRTAVVGKENDFRFDRLMPGRWRLIHEADARKRSEDQEEALHVEIESGATTTVKIDPAGELPCQLLGSFRLGGEHPSGNWVMNLYVDRNRIPSPRLEAGGVFRVSPLQLGRFRWSAVSRGNSVQVYQQNLVLHAGENKLDIDVPVGRLELKDLPLPDKVDLGGDVRMPCCLTWKGTDGVSWIAYLAKAKGGALTLKRVPVGTIQLRYQPEGSHVAPHESPVVAEIEIRAGETKKFTWPPQ